VIKVQGSFLAVYSAVVSTVVLAMVLAGAVPRSQAAFDELTVQRINVIEPNGTPRMLISNDDRTSFIALMDASGRKRIMMSVDNAGNPSIALLDAAGNVTEQIAP
jgi:hypothetical protein